MYICTQSISDLDPTASMFAKNIFCFQNLFLVIYSQQAVPTFGSAAPLLWSSQQRQTLVVHGTMKDIAFIRRIARFNIFRGNSRSILWFLFYFFQSICLSSLAIRMFFTVSSALSGNKCLNWQGEGDTQLSQTKEVKLGCNWCSWVLKNPVAHRLSCS